MNCGGWTTHARTIPARVHLFRLEARRKLLDTGCGSGLTPGARLCAYLSLHFFPELALDQVRYLAAVLATL